MFSGVGPEVFVQNLLFSLALVGTSPRPEPVVSKVAAQYHPSMWDGFDRM